MKHRRIRYGGPRPTAIKTPSLDATVDILSLSLDARGVARPDGKTLFVRDALPGDRVKVRIEKSDKRFDEGVVSEIISASNQRIEPPCPHYGKCGGCDLQHLDTTAAVTMKQNEVLAQLERRAKIVPTTIDSPLMSALHTGYRRAARVGINQRESGELLIGFRRRSSAKLVDIDQCLVLTPGMNQFLQSLRRTLEGFDRVKHLTQVEMVEGQTGLAVELRATRPLSDTLSQKLIELAIEHEADLWLRIKDGTDKHLHVRAAATELEVIGGITLEYRARDFIQVNADVNDRMITRVIDWLNPQSNERVLDLFSGLGNFSLPLAKQVAELTAVEGSKEMVERCLHNAAKNGIENLQAHSADLANPSPDAPWLKEQYDILLLDPPRQGAPEILEHLKHQKARALVYVACDPASLVRDAATLIQQGYQMSRFCVADMFPQTHHIESLALFERC